MAKTSLSRRKLFDHICDSGSIHDIDESLNKATVMIKQHYRIENKDLNPEITKHVSSFLYRLRNKWTASHRIRDKFIRKNSDWLDDNIFSDEVESQLQVTHPPSTSKTKEQTMSSEWESLSTRSKQRKAKELLKQKQTPELLFTARQGAYQKDPNLRYVLKCLSKSPSRSKEVRNLMHKRDKAEPESFTSDEALSLMIDTNMTKQSYQTLRSTTKRKHSDIYPTYNYVREAKRKCYPENIQINEHSAKVPLQDLLDHTAIRIIEQTDTITEAVAKIPGDEKLSCTLISKWGFDGASGHSEYKQKFTSPDISDDSIFSTTLVPLQMKSRNDILWHNPVPSSTRFCRPIHLQFQKETKQLCQEEETSVKQEIGQLQPTTIIMDTTDTTLTNNDRTVEIKHEVHHTMVDQKVINALTDTNSSMRCYICDATPKQFNNLTNFPQPKTDTYKYGISPLHKWIRCFEMLIHISYRMEVKKWRISSAEDKSKVSSKKKLVHDRFKSEMGLRVDEPKQGAGNSNDGNTARRAFEQEDKFAKICDLDESLIHNFHMILVAISCKHPIDPDKFQSYCHDTAKLLVHLYPWFMMPVSIHVLLIHGASILDSSILPIGMMSEEAQEARNKDNKLFRLKHARKTSRADNMSDVFHRLMVTGDIVISSRSLSTPKSHALPNEVRHMLKHTDSAPSEDNTDTTDTSDSDAE